MRNLVIVAGHAIFQGGRWYGGHPGEDHFYAQHVEAGVEHYRSLPSCSLILSGGHTRPNDEAVQSGIVTNSEAEGMLEYARTRFSEPDLRNVLVEGLARDSFENVFFSLLCAFHHFGSWPATVHMVSWPFKANRFYLIACGLRLGDGRFFFHGHGDLEDQRTMEIVTQANVQYEQDIVSSGEIVDPLHRGEGFAEKRARRTPLKFPGDAEYMAAVKSAYDRVMVSDSGSQHDVSKVIDTVESARPGRHWRDIRWPW